MYVDTPRDYVGSVYEELLFGSNPLGWETLGTKETIQGATRETFLDYLGEWYTPARMVVGVAGAVGDDLLPTLEGLLGDLPGNGAGARPGADRAVARAARADPPQGLRPGERRLGVPSYPLGHPDRYALQLLGTVLGTGMSSRLFLEVRERRGLAYYVFAFNNSFTDAGTLYAQAGVDLKRAEEAVEVIATEFRKLADEPVPAEELEKARALAKGRFVLQTESPNGLIVRAAPRGARRQGRRAGGDPRRPRRRHRRGRATRRAGRDRRSGLRCAVIGPFDDASKFEALL